MNNKIWVIVLFTFLNVVATREVLSSNFEVAELSNLANSAKIFSLFTPNEELLEKGVLPDMMMWRASVEAVPEISGMKSELDWHSAGDMQIQSPFPLMAQKYIEAGSSITLSGSMRVEESGEQLSSRRNPEQESNLLILFTGGLIALLGSKIKLKKQFSTFKNHRIFKGTSLPSRVKA